MFDFVFKDWKLQTDDAPKQGFNEFARSSLKLVFERETDQLEARAKIIIFDLLEKDIHTEAAWLNLSANETEKLRIQNLIRSAVVYLVDFWVQKGLYTEQSSESASYGGLSSSWQNSYEKGELPNIVLSCLKNTGLYNKVHFSSQPKEKTYISQKDAYSSNMRDIVLGGSSGTQEVEKRLKQYFNDEVKKLLGKLADNNVDQQFNNLDLDTWVNNFVKRIEPQLKIDLAIQLKDKSITKRLLSDLIILDLRQITTNKDNIQANNKIIIAQGKAINSLLNLFDDDDKLKIGNIKNASIVESKLHADVVAKLNKAFNKSDYFTLNAEKLTSNDRSNNPGVAALGERYKGIIRIGHLAKGVISIGWLAGSGITLGAESRGDINIAPGAFGVGKLYAANRSAEFTTFDKIVAAAKQINDIKESNLSQTLKDKLHLHADNLRRQELIYAAVYAGNDTWTDLIKEAEIFDTISYNNGVWTFNFNNNLPNGIPPGYYQLGFRFTSKNGTNKQMFFLDHKYQGCQLKTFGTRLTKTNFVNKLTGQFNTDIDYTSQFRYLMDIYHNGNEKQITWKGERVPGFNVSGGFLDFYEFKGSGTFLRTGANEYSWRFELNGNADLKNGSFIYIWRVVSN